MSFQAVCWLIAVVLFAVSTKWSALSGLSLVSLGLAFFALGFLVPLA